MKHIGWISVLAIFSLTGCVTDRALLESQLNSNEAKSFITTPSHGNVYIYLVDGVNSPLAPAGAPIMTSNGVRIGMLDPHTFLKIKLEPGQYQFGSKMVNAYPVTIKVEGNKNYFLRSTIGWSNFVMDQIQPDLGMRAVKSRLMARSFGIIPKAQPTVIKIAE